MLVARLPHMKKSVTRLLTALLALCAATVLSAQTRSISGTVVCDDDDSPAPGAYVYVTGTSTGTVTDAGGYFRLDGVPSSATTLTASLLGFKDQEALIQADMVIRLKPENEVLDEVMVVAYGTARKSSYSGSASVVRADQMEGLPVTSFENALTGKVAGLQITSSSGQAGSAPSLRIRGNGSMNASNDPLYVIDGVPVISGSIGQMGDHIYTSNNAMGGLNPDDIASVSVLKDAAASSLYGSRAANGVVIITTKTGRKGRPTVSLKASVGITPCWATDNYETVSVQDNIDMLFSVFYDYRVDGKGETEDQAIKYAINQLNTRFNKHGYKFSASGTGKYQHINIEEYDNSGRGGEYFDWEKAYFRTAVYQNYDLSVSGGTDVSNYYSSISYTKDEGRLRVNDFDRFSGRVNLFQKVGKRVDLNTNVSVARSSKSGYNDTRSTGNNFFMQTRNLLWGMYWPTNYSDGSDFTARYGSYARNGLYLDKHWENSSINTRIDAAETLTIHLFKGFDVKSIFSYANTTVRDHLYFDENHPSGSATIGEVHEMRTVYEKYVSSTTANYSKSFGNNNLSLLAGFEAEKNKTDFTRASGSNLPSSSLHTVSTAGTTQASGYNWGNAMVSVLAKADYNWAEKYYASASWRTDASSRLAPRARWDSFWSVAASWRIGKENFLKNADWLDELKLRASYGTNGTLPSSNYGYMNLITFSNKYLGNPGGSISTIGNSLLTWETSRSANIGIDFAVLDNRLGGSVELFNRDSHNLLQDKPVSTVTGFSSTLQNIGKTRNRGIEIELYGDIIRTKNLVWSASFNASILSSKVVSLSEGKDIIWYDPTGDDDRAQFIYREKESTLAFYGYEWAGVDKTNGKSVYYVNDPKDPNAGDFIFKGRGATYDYNDAYETIIGDAVAKVAGGFATSLRFKNFDASLGFNYKIGGNLYDGAEKDVSDDGYYFERIRSRDYFENRWTPDNPDGTQPEIKGLDLEDAMQYSSRHIYSASFLRLKTLSLGYSLPKKWLKAAGITGTRFFFTGTNLLTLSKYKLADPEVNEYGTRGWETPFGKTFTFGVDIKF